MEASFPPVLAVLAGLFAAGLFFGAFSHWVALLHTTLAKHGGSFLGPARRRLFLAAPFVFLLHPVPYLTVALLLVSVLAALGVIARGWWWFLGPFYAFFAFMAVILAKGSVRKQGVIHALATDKRIWPFDALERRGYQRQYRAAWALFLVQGTFYKLSQAQQADITERVTRLLLESGVDAYAFPPRSDSLPLIYAAQMKALGIAPALSDEPWPLAEKLALPTLDPNPWRFWIPKPISRLFWMNLRLRSACRRGGHAVDDARRDIVARGLEIPPTVPRRWRS